MSSARRDRAGGTPAADQAGTADTGVPGQRGTQADTEYQEGYQQPGQGYETGQPQGRDTGQRQGYETDQGYRDRGYQEQGYREPAARRGGRVDDRHVARASFAGRLLAAVLLMVGGLWMAFVGAINIVRGTFFGVVRNYPFYFSVQSRGVLLLILGGVMFAAGTCVLLGMLWARIFGMFVAALSAIANFLFLPYSPFYSILMIALDIFIIWALAHHHEREHERAAYG